MSGEESAASPDATDDEKSDSAGTASERRKPVVVVVEPETPGNVGTIARAMKNFGLSDLKLVDPRNWRRTARRTASPDTRARTCSQTPRR